MTSLPSGLASISSRLDDSPNARGAVALGRMVREREEAQTETVTLTIDQMPSCVHSPVRWNSCEEAVEIYGEPEQEAIDRHAALAVSGPSEGHRNRANHLITRGGRI